MNIAFYGSSLLSSYWNGAATYYRGLLQALAAYGHDITFYEPDILDRQSHRDIAPPTWCKVVVYPTRCAEHRPGAAAMVARNSSSSANPTPLALTTTSAVAAPFTAARSPSSVAGYTTTSHQSGGAMSRWLWRSRMSGS